MAIEKTRSIFVCQECGRHSPRHMGRCPGCNKFNSMIEETQAIRKGHARTGARVVLPNTLPRPLEEIATQEHPRLRVPLNEFNRVLGGGIVPGSITLIGGEPGIGKSTLLIQVSCLIAASLGRVLYVSGEESTIQIKMRAERLGLKAEQLYLVTETNLHAILEHVRVYKPMLLIVDSIQTVYIEDSESSPGSVSQVRECAARLQMLAKTTGTSVFIIGHVTKEGNIAGPRVLEHVVDTVLYLEGDSFGAYRLLRGVKNRFGATHEIGVFEMTGQGMIEVSNPSEVFLSERMAHKAGTAVAVIMEGTRPLLVEVQALTSPTPFGNPRRTTNGVEYNRMLMITAVLAKQIPLRLHECDIFTNVVGGVKISEPAADLAVAVAIASSYHSAPVPADLAFIGEVGLNGELRTVSQLAARLHEALKLGFRKVMMPKMYRLPADIPPGLQLIEVSDLSEVLAKCLPDIKKSA